MQQITLKAHAKINLSLDIVGRREDGYHLMQMVMMQIPLADVVYLKKTTSCIIKLSGAGMPLDSRNIGYRAADIFFRYTGFKNLGLEIHITKHIPIGAGLGGGSADGAAVIRGLNRLYSNKLSIKQLCEIGAGVGSDIPFCIVGGTALVKGIGDVITPLPMLDGCFIVVCKPKSSVNTANAFSIYDYNNNMDKEYREETKGKHPDTALMLNAIKHNDLCLVADNMKNVFEEVIKHEDIEHIKRVMKHGGALNAMMTGSGSAVFGLFDDHKKAHECVRLLRKMYRDCFL